MSWTISATAVSEGCRALNIHYSGEGKQAGGYSITYPAWEPDYEGGELKERQDRVSVDVAYATYTETELTKLIDDLQIALVAIRSNS